MSSTKPHPSQDYKSAGVNVESGDSLVEWLQASDGQFSESVSPVQIQRQQKLKTQVIDGIGGFASVFMSEDLKAMNEPCLVTCTDGVGTKVKLASEFSRFEGIGQDLVAMCVNDLVTTGAQPLLFLDYYASGKLDLVAAQAFLKSVKQACAQSHCLLIGGETAEMPGVYQNNDFDCAGFAVGVVEKSERLGAHLVQDKDVMIGVSSSGFHSNGYSLLRKVFATDAKDWLEVLLKPTHLYVDLVLNLKKSLHSVAHITGGGIDNIPRALPESATYQLKPWEFPAEFIEVQKRTGLSREQMLKTLNCGVGLVLVASQEQQSSIESAIKAMGFKSYFLGEVRL